MKYKRKIRKSALRIMLCGPGDQRDRLLLWKVEKSVGFFLWSGKDTWKISD
jgi:hypothetical protein